jgi:hypothetical protein
MNLDLLPDNIRGHCLVIDIVKVPVLTYHLRPPMSFSDMEMGTSSNYK